MVLLACGLATLSVEPTAGASIRSLVQADYTIPLYLEADSQTGGPFISVGDPNVTTTGAYKDPQAGAASGAVASAGFYSGAGPPQVIEFTARKGMAERCFLNLSAPVTGTIWWGNSYFDAIKGDGGLTYAAVGSLIGLENGRFRVELFADDVRIGGSDRQYTIPPVVFNPALPRGGFDSMAVGFRAEVHSIDVGAILKVRISRVTDNLDFFVGTQDPFQSVLKLRCFVSDPLAGVLYLEDGDLFVLEGSDEPAADPPSVLTLAALSPFLVFAFRRAPKRASSTLLRTLLVAALLGLAGCIAGDPPEPNVDPSRPPITGQPADIERGSSPNATLVDRGVGALGGIVRNGERAGLPLGNVNVIVVGTSRFVTTGTDGVYEFEDLTPSTYTIRFDRTGFLAVEETSVIVAGVRNFLNVTLLTPEIAKARGYSNVNPHPHDLWGGKTRLQVQSLSFTPKYAEEGYQALNDVSWSCLEAELFLTCGVALPIEKRNPILPGTTLVEVKAHWDAASPGTPKEMSLGIRTPTNPYGYPLVARAPDQWYRLPVFPNEANPGHQNFTNWIFVLSAPTGTIYNPAHAAYRLGPVDVEIWINKGVVPLEPKHRDFWNGNQTLATLHESVLEPNCGSCDVPQKFDNVNARDRWRLNGMPGAWVPPGTEEIRVRLNWSYTGTPILGDARWTLRYKGADSPIGGYDARQLPLLPETHRETNGVEFVFRPQSHELDKFYQSASYWVFVLDDGKEPLQDDYGSVSYQLNYAALPGTSASVTFTLTVVSVKDPGFTDDWGGA